MQPKPARVSRVKVRVALPSDNNNQEPPYPEPRTHEIVKFYGWPLAAEIRDLPATAPTLPVGRWRSDRYKQKDYLQVKGTMRHLLQLLSKIVKTCFPTRTT